MVVMCFVWYFIGIVGYFYADGFHFYEIVKV